jgi:hypothetical protein
MAYRNILALSGDERDLFLFIRGGKENHPRMDTNEHERENLRLELLNLSVRPGSSIPIPIPEHEPPPANTSRGVVISFFGPGAVILIKVRVWNTL